MNRHDVGFRGCEMPLVAENPEGASSRMGTVLWLVQKTFLLVCDRELRSRGR